MTASVMSRFITAWGQPAGTNMLHNPKCRMGWQTGGTRHTQGGRERRQTAGQSARSAANSKQTNKQTNFRHAQHRAAQRSPARTAQRSRLAGVLDHVNRLVLLRPVGRLQHAGKRVIVEWAQHFADSALANIRQRQASKTGAVHSLCPLCGHKCTARPPGCGARRL